MRQDEGHVPRPEAISSEIADVLKEAFLAKDRRAANEAARLAYEVKF